QSRAEWSRLRPLARRLPAFLKPADLPERTLYIKGISANLKANDALLLLFPGGNDKQVWRVRQSTPNPTEGVTAVNVVLWTERAQSADQAGLPDAVGGVNTALATYGKTFQLGFVLS